jgi:hypothetical protein
MQPAVPCLGMCAVAPDRPPPSARAPRRSCDWSGLCHVPLAQASSPRRAYWLRFVITDSSGMNIEMTMNPTMNPSMTIMTGSSAAVRLSSWASTSAS